MIRIIVVYGGTSHLPQNMTQVSRRYISKQTQRRIVSLFLSSIVLASSEREAASFFEDFLTPTEKIMLAKRFSIAFMLLNGYDYQTICKTLKVTTGTVGDVSLMLKIKGDGIRKIVKKIMKNETMKKIWNEIKDGIDELFASAPGKDWSRSKKELWQRRSEREGRF